MKNVHLACLPLTRMKSHLGEHGLNMGILDHAVLQRADGGRGSVEHRTAGADSDPKIFRGNGGTRSPGLRHSRRSLARGVAAVEFALVLPLLIVLLLGIIDFGLMMYDKAMITNAAREGARAGIVLRNPRLPEAQIAQVSRDYCGNLVITLLGEPQCTVSVTFHGPRELGSRLQVDVDFRYEGPVMSALAMLPGAGPMVPVDMRSTAVMLHE